MPRWNVKKMIQLAASLLEPSTFGTITVIALIVTILVADIFFSIEEIAVVGLLLVSIYLTLLIDIAWQWQILVLILIWLLTTGIFYFGWRAIASPLSKLIASKEKETIEKALGDHCKFRVINGQHFAYWNGDLWPAQVEPGHVLEDGQEALIKKNESGKFHIKPIEKSK